MKYDEIDPKILRRYFDLMEKHGRHVDTKYSDNKCGKEKFVIRTMKKWIGGKCFKVITQEHQNFSPIKRAVVNYICIVGVRFTMGYNDSVSIHFIEPQRPSEICIVNYSFNDFLRLQWKQITLDDFKSVLSMYVDDREDNEYIMEAWTQKRIGKGKDKKHEKVILKVKGKDYQHARNMATEQYPEYVIYG